MIDFFWTEWLLILVLGAVLIGPKELPVIAKALGKIVAKSRYYMSLLEKILQESLSEDACANQNDDQKQTNHWIDLPKQKSQNKWD
jgi:Sec-independent protein translocase protein TatA